MSRINPTSNFTSSPVNRPISTVDFDLDLDSNDINNICDQVNLYSLASGNLTREGKLPFIVSSNEEDSIKTIKKKLAENFSREEVKFQDELPIVGGLKIDVSPDKLSDMIDQLPEGVSIAIDSHIHFPDPGETCKINENRPSLDISNSTLGINRLWEKGYTGEGVCICVIDSGIHPHPDFEGRIKAFADMHRGKEGPYDPYGHGTHVAGVAAGSGVQSAGKYRGVAPKADLVGVRITSVAEAIKGIQWAIENKEKYNIKVVNMSLGDYPILPHNEDPWAQAAAKAWDAGLLVVVASGNEGPGQSTISTPGLEPKVLTVGFIDDKSTPERSDDEIARNSSRGPALGGVMKPDVVAPGVKIFGPLAKGSIMDTPDKEKPFGSYIADTGSSMATPMVAGLGALLLQANPDLTNEDIKKILMTSADEYIPGARTEDQGAGLIDPEEALMTALKYPAKAEKKTDGMDVPAPKILEPDSMLISDDVIRNSRQA